MMNDTDLDNLRSDKRFKAVLAKVKKVGDYLDILQKAPGYTHNERPDTLPRFEYINPNNKYLVRGTPILQVGQCGRRKRTNYQK